MHVEAGESVAAHSQARVVSRSRLLKKQKAVGSNFCFSHFRTGIALQWG